MKGRWLLGVLPILLVAPSAAVAQQVSVRGPDGLPVAGAMITRTPLHPPAPDTRDRGYPQPGERQQAPRWTTVFAGADGSAALGPVVEAQRVRVRHPQFADAEVDVAAGSAAVTVSLSPWPSEQARAEAKPANTWAAGVDFGSPKENKIFAMQCGFCHQQGSAFVRSERSEANWSQVITRMVGYGARLPTALQRKAPAVLRAAYAKLRANPAAVADPLPWQPAVAGARIDQWPLGDRFSQLHDMILHPNGLVYVGDNLQDRLYELDPTTGAYTVYKLPHAPDDALGGHFAARLASFPQHQSYVALHSLAVSPRDGQIFMTPSIQRRIIAFDPKTKAFAVTPLQDGLYPHTIRVDARDRVWFTLALSNQVGMIDRATGQQHIIDLPTRTWGEAATIRLVPLLFQLATLGLPLAKLAIDDQALGTPLPYGIDLAPDGTVWVARLHANDLMRIDADTLEVTQVAFPAAGPRRLRTDAQGRVWVSAFGEGAVLAYHPATGQFTRHELPTLPKGSDTPYSLQVDRARQIVWVTGTASDTLMALDIQAGTWQVFALPQRMTFTRDIDVAEDGSVFTSNGAFPAWHTEGAQPTLLRVVPSWAKAAP